MPLNHLGEMAAACRHAIPHHFPRVVLDEAIIMPNHIHGIIVTVGAKHPLSPFMCLRNDRNRMLRPDDHVLMVRVNRIRAIIRIAPAGRWLPRLTSELSCRTSRPEQSDL